MTDMLEHALAYARRGIAVLPAHPTTTALLVKRDRGHDDPSLPASTDEAAVRLWWERWPQAMVAVPTGAASGLFIVKIAGGQHKEAGVHIELLQAVVAIENALGAELPETVVVATPEGARHYYFAAPDERLPRSRSGLTPNMEARGDGGHAILPPSVRSDGGHYAFVHSFDDFSPAEAPPALLDWIHKRGRFAKAPAKSAKPKKTRPAPLAEIVSDNLDAAPAPRPRPKRRGAAVPDAPSAEALRSNDPVVLRRAAQNLRNRYDPDPHEPRGGAGPGQKGAHPWTENMLGLPNEDPCPVRALGIDGDYYWFLDSARQLRRLRDGQITHAVLQGIFAGSPNYPAWAWPRWSKPKLDRDGNVVDPPEIQSFKDDDVRTALFRACERMGIFSPEQMLRGRGAWKRADQSIVYHAGAEVWTIEQGEIRPIECGLIDDANEQHVYPRLRKLPPPWLPEISDDDNPARQLIEGFRKWNWEMPEVAPVLLLGWIGVAYLGAALDWRSTVFLIGDKSTGKSTLQTFLKDVFGDALFDRADTTAADIYQKLGSDVRPVAVDEIEGGPHNEKVTKVIELARVAASGAFGGRGGSEGHGSEFQLRSAFLFSAINTPPLMQQDLSRMALLRLRKLTRQSSATPPTIDADTCGRKVLGRLLREWHRFPDLYAKYRATLEEGGHDGRGQDTYGTLLACADLLLGPSLAEDLKIPMGDDTGAWADLLNVENLPEVQGAEDNWLACLSHLLSSPTEISRNGARVTVGELLEELELNGEDPARQPKFVKQDLKRAGLAVKKIDGIDGWILCVPNQHQLVARLFYGSRWQGAPGVGVWESALRQGVDSGVIIADRKLNRERIGFKQHRCTLVVLSQLDKPDATHDPPARGDPPSSRATEANPAPSPVGFRKEIPSRTVDDASQDRRSKPSRSKGAG